MEFEEKMVERLPLANVRVTDFTWAWAGPYSTSVLALLGAEVIKIESRRRLDHSRARSLMTGPILQGPDYSTVFNDLNFNKFSLTLDMTKPESVRIAKELVEVSDVVVENMRPGKIAAMGLSYDEIRKVRPDIIMLSSSASGAAGPEGSYVGYAPTFCAVGGLAYISGYPDGAPTALSGAVDLRVGATAAFAVIAALVHRQQTGEGQFIDLSSSEAIASLVGHTFLDYSLNQRIPFREGNHDRTMAPHNCYPCHGEDEWITISVGTEEEWHALCVAMGDPAWANDEQFCTMQRRLENQDELDRKVAEWTKEYGQQEVADSLQKGGIAAMPCYDGPQVVADPHVVERDVFQKVTHPLLGERMVPGPPWRFSDTPARVRRAAPLLGEHNRYVLHEILGMPEEEIARLEEEKVVW